MTVQPFTYEKEFRVKRNKFIKGILRNGLLTITVRTGNDFRNIQPREIHVNPKQFPRLYKAVLNKDGKAIGFGNFKMTVNRDKVWLKPKEQKPVLITYQPFFALLNCFNRVMT